MVTRKIIKLVNNELTIKINESNSLYKIISGCVGESFVVQEEEIDDDVNQTKKQDPPVYEKIDRNDIWVIYNNTFPDKEDKGTTVAVLIKNHLHNVIGGAYPELDEENEYVRDFGQTSLEMVGDDLYKKGNSYLKYRK